MSILRIALYTEGLTFTGDTLAHRPLGGSETAFISLARALAARGHEVTAICRCEREGVFDGVQYRDVRSADEVLGRGGDLLICSRYFGIFTRRLPWRARFLWMHDVLVPGTAQALGTLLPRIDRVFTVSDYHKALCVRALPELAPRIATIGNGVDVAQIDAAVAGAGPKRHRVMFTSRPERGLLRALAIYEQLGDRTLELLACSYPSLPDPEVAALEARCAAQITALRARGFQIAVGGFTKNELYRHLAESKAVLYPTDFPEVFCISAIEAQACGTVFLTTDDFALRETVGYERVPNGDHATFFSRLQTLLGDESTRRALEERGRAHALTFTWERAADKFLNEADAVLHPVPAVVPSIGFFDRISASVPVSAGVFADDDEVDRVVEVARRANTAARLPRRQTFAAVSDGPMISCLTVTRGRLRLLKESIRCYLDQTWERREMVIVCDAEPRRIRAIEHYLASLARDDIRLIVVEGNDSTLGRLRNLSLDAARGEIVCQWDDDDLYHPERLAAQARKLAAENAIACFLTDQLHYFATDGRLFWTDWSGNGRVPGVWALIPGSLMMRRDSRFRYPETGAAARRGEDSALLDAMFGHVPIARLSGAGYLYVYRYHGDNTFPLAHHAGQQNRAAPADFVRERARELMRAIDYYPLPRPLTVCSRTEQLLRVEA